MKFSFRQILASAAGAVIAALIASSFGVAGTIVGVAIGSMAATMGTALVAQSIERGQKAVKQVVVRVPEGPTSTLLRRVGGTVAAGGATSSVDGGPKEPEPTEVVGAAGGASEMESAVTNVDATDRLRVPAADVEKDAPTTEHFEAATVPLVPGAVSEGAGVRRVTGAAGVATAADSGGQAGGRRFTWKAFAGTAAIVFVLALAVVTAVELIANRPTVFTPSSPGTSPTTTTSTPSTTSTSTSTSSPTSSTTSTTAPSNTTTSTTAPGVTTTTNNLNSTSTTTSTPGL